MALKEGNISLKQERFCQELVIDLNATKAAERAGYTVKTAKQTGARLLTNKYIATRVNELQAAIAEAVGVTAEMVVKELCKLAFTDLKDVVDFNGKKPRIKSPMELADPEKLGAISEFTEITNGNKVTRRIKMHDKKGSLELLGRHLGMFNDKLSLPVSGEVIHKIERVVIDGTAIKQVDQE
jgi:phage terminase small subunit